MLVRSSSSDRRFEITLADPGKLTMNVVERIVTLDDEHSAIPLQDVDNPLKGENFAAFDINLDEVGTVAAGVVEREALDRLLFNDRHWSHTLAADRMHFEDRVVP